MIHSKHHKVGMSFIEVMGALALFAIFGSSLFIAQTYIFERLSLVQHKVLAAVRMQEEAVTYQMEILKELFANQGTVEKSLQPKTKKITAPAMDIVTKALALQDITPETEKESILKKFQNLYLLSVTAENPDKKGTDYGRLYMFVYIPQVKK